MLVLSVNFLYSFDNFVFLPKQVFNSRKLRANAMIGYFKVNFVDFLSFKSYTSLCRPTFSKYFKN